MPFLVFIGTLALLLALGWLLSGCSGARPAPVAGTQTAQAFERQVPVRLPYLLYLPQDYAAGEQDWPLVVFLHGAGERGDDLEKVKVHGPPKHVAQGEHFPFILVSPQAPEGQRWEPATLEMLVDDVVERYRVDEDRIYLTGLSMGGFGTWDLAMARPEAFAAIAPVCGGGRAWSACMLKEVPTWVFHGAKDTVVPIGRSEEMVEALEKCGGDVRFTVYPEAGHDSWTETYANPAFYEWLLSQRRGEEGS